jgi:predicted tellurium resistance membrane protein TerC
VVAVWLASVTAIVDAASFHVTAVSKAIFVLTAILWFATTTLGLVRALQRRFAERHEWMVRSYSLSLFVVSFSILVPALAATALPTTVSYPLGLVLSTTLNLALAELWIRRHRGGRSPFHILALCGFN